jgi:hypothetical protein
MSISNHYQTLICGATFAGIGMAVSQPTSTFIVESSSSVGTDFIACLNPGRHWDLTLQSEHGQDLRQEMRNRNLLTEDGSVHLPGLYPLLCERIHRAKLNVLFLTDIVKVERMQGSYEVTLHNVSGFTKIRVEQIIDTTTARLSVIGAKQLPISKKINAYIDASEAGAVIPSLSEDPNVEILQGRFTSEFICKLTISPEDDWLSARRKLNEYWQSRPEGLQSWRITSIASAFELETAPAESISDSWRLVPSSAFANPLIAFDSKMEQPAGKGEIA